VTVKLLSPEHWFGGVSGGGGSGSCSAPISGSASQYSGGTSTTTAVASPSSLSESVGPQKRNAEHTMQTIAGTSVQHKISDTYANWKSVPSHPFEVESDSVEFVVEMPPAQSSHANTRNEPYTIQHN
jgi:hypothetical protein